MRLLLRRYEVCIAGAMGGPRMAARARPARSAIAGFDTGCASIEAADV